jgi:hypothetical protein
MWTITLCCRSDLCQIVGDSNPKPHGAFASCKGMTKGGRE